MDSSSQKNSFNRGRSPFHYIQIHLSTAIVLMFVAGGLLALNLRPRKIQIFEERTVRSVDYRIYGQIGWPSVIVEGVMERGFSSGMNANTERIERAEAKFKEMPVPRLADFFDESEVNSFFGPRTYRFSGMVINFSVTVIILLAVMTGIEVFLRRREARAP